MKFVDEALISVAAGKGGDGCLSFRREKNIPLGGPDGGDGGDGGSVILQASPHINTLIDFRYTRIYKAKNGLPGMGRDRRGKSANDLVITVPVGTVIHDNDTGELIADLAQAGQTQCVAQGGFHGIGNARFKSSVNRAPRETTPGSAGESRHLKLELKLLADVGLLGLPNAGKSTLIRAVSNATPKVADYPFTTLYPSLGVVRVGDDKSFVISDIPGLIEGAHDGVGLGVRFLKHLSRTGLLLHLVDIATDEDPVAAINMILSELIQYDPALYDKPRWLVFNKVDLLSEQEAEERIAATIKAVGWTGPVYVVSAMKRQKTQALCYDLMAALDARKA